MNQQLNSTEKAPLFAFPTFIVLTCTRMIHMSELICHGRAGTERVALPICFSALT